MASLRDLPAPGRIRPGSPAVHFLSIAARGGLTLAAQPGEDRLGDISTWTGSGLATQHKSDRTSRKLLDCKI